MSQAHDDKSVIVRDFAFEIAGEDADVTKATFWMSRIKAIRRRYQALVNRYCTMPLAQRHAVTPASGRERFYCVALLEFQMYEPELTPWGHEDNGVKPQVFWELPDKEWCPVSHEWYNELWSAYALMEGVTGFLPAYLHKEVESLMWTAWQALLQAEEWLDTMMAVKPAADNCPQLARLEAWNVLCTEFKDSELPLSAALHRAENHLASCIKTPWVRPEDFAGAERVWFEVSLPRPWEDSREASPKSDRPQSSAEGQS